MTLGDLEFKVEDLDETLLIALADFGAIPKEKVRFIAKMVIGKNNEILRERLEKAPTVKGWLGDGVLFSTFLGEDVPTDKFAIGKCTHTARLVCVEELKK